MEIIDDFLPQNKFQVIQDFFMGPDIPWYYNKNVDYPDDLGSLDDFQFTHTFFRNDPGDVGITTLLERWRILRPYLDKFNYSAMLRVKANLNTRTSKIDKRRWHIDTTLRCKTAIAYMNTNNGYTSFKDGTKVDSVANRVVIFNSQLSHKGATCTDQKTRVVINFNFIDTVGSEVSILSEKELEGAGL